MMITSGAPVDAVSLNKRPAKLPDVRALLALVDPDGLQFHQPDLVYDADASCAIHRLGFHPDVPLLYLKVIASESGRGTIGPANDSSGPS